MRLEILTPDAITLLEFKKSVPPDGVIIHAETPPQLQQFSANLNVDVSVIIDVAAIVKATGVATVILTAFRHYLRKHPNADCTINGKQVKLDHSEIVARIEEVRTEEQLKESSDADGKE